MNFRQPPALAVWLLKRLGLTKRNEPLTGDLFEEFRNGRTAAWYWRQTFMAIATEFRQRLQFHRLDLLSLFVGWGAETCVLLAWWIFQVPVGLHGFVLGVSTLATIWMAMYIEYRVRLIAWRNDLDSSEQESDDILHGRISPRSGALFFFGIALLLDGVGILVTRLPLPGPSYLPTVSLLLILNVVMLFAFAAVLVLRFPGDSADGAACNGNSPGLRRRVISGLESIVFLFAVVQLYRDNRVAETRLLWFEPVCWSLLTFTLILTIFTFVGFAARRMLRSHPRGDE